MSACQTLQHARCRARHQQDGRRNSRQFRLDHGITPTFKMVDTCCTNLKAATPYYYSCYADEDEVKPLGKKSVIVLGSARSRIGQGIEFDYCSSPFGLGPAQSRHEQHHH